MRFHRFIFQAVLIILLGCACADAPLMERYEQLSSDGKHVFLAYYPVLTQDQRDELLASRGSRSLGENWRIEDKELRARVDPFPSFMGNPSSYTLTALNVEIPRKEPIRDGGPLEIHAILKYADGRTSEVTRDVEWRVVPPELGNINKNKLRYDCLASDITVVATFLDEREGSRTLRIRKPLRGLELRLDKALASPKPSEFLKFDVIAHCEDGSSTDVSCQSDWSSPSKAGSIHGCGHFQITSNKILAEDPVEISASYGGQSVTRKIRIPIAE